MGNMSEARILIVVFTFLTAFVLLISITPSQFYATVTMTNTTVPTVPYYASDLVLGDYNETWNTYTNPINETGGYYQTWYGESWYIVTDVGTGGKFGGHDIDLWYIPANSSFIHSLVFRHNYAWWSYAVDFLHWRNKAGVDRGASLIVDDLQKDLDAANTPYTLSCDHFHMYADLFYNTTIYASAWEAWNHHGLYMTMGIGFDQMGASFDAWSLIAKIVSFQAIDGVPFPINIMLSSAMWAAIGYVVFIFALRVIGAVFGGGGA